MQNMIIIVFLFFWCSCQSIPVDTSPHFDENKWHTYQTIVEEYVFEYKIPSSDEYPLKRKGTKTVPNGNYFVNDLAIDFNGIFESQMDTGKPTPFFRLSLDVRRYNNTYKTGFNNETAYEMLTSFKEGVLSRSNMTGNDLLINGRKWFRKIRYSENNNKYISSVCYYFALNEKHLISVYAYFGEAPGYYGDWENSDEWYAKRLELTQKVVESLKISKLKE